MTTTVPYSPINSTDSLETNISVNSTESSEENISTIAAKILDTYRTKRYVIIYSAFILASICLTFARSMLFYKISMTASRGLHNKMFSSILKAPMRFFDTNPSGE